MTMRQIMARAHELARTMVGDYGARLVLALRQAWREARAASSVTTITRLTKSGKEYTVTYGWQTVDRKVWLDGHTFVRQEEQFVFEVSVEEYGKVADAYLRKDAEHGPSIIGTVRHNGKQYRIVMQIDDVTFETLAAAKHKHRVQPTIDPMTKHPGYCWSCHSVCYGDCKANAN